MAGKAVYGLTGNMGSGKSTVAKMLEEFPDVVVFDTDAIAKEILCDAGNAQKIRELFGLQVFSEGKVDIRKVARLVFNDYAALRELEGFLHPRVLQVIEEMMAEDKKASLFFVEAALLYESGWADYFTGIVVVTCAKDEQYRRLRDHRGFSNEEIDRRLKRQLPAQDKLKLADFIIDTNCSLEEVKKEVEALYHRLKK